MAEMMIPKQKPKVSETDGLQNGVLPKQPKRKNRYKSYKRYKKAKNTSNRTCRICGKNPYPNYFFCPGCHHKVDTYEEK